MLDRRAFLGALPPLALASAACAREAASTSATRARTGWGIQLYTLRSVISQDVDGTLAQIASAGYREVELAGLYGLTPQQMRAKLDAVGLVAASSHQSVPDLRGDWARVLDGARALGQELIVVPAIPDPERTPEALRGIADEFNRAGEAARAAGLRFGYHNHDWEHRALPDGTVPMDLLLERTDPAAVDWQMDIFWTVHGGGDPGAYLRANAGRVTSVHVKDRTSEGRMADVGAGVIDFARLIPLAEELGLRHAFVEHDQPGDDPVASARRSVEHLRRILP